jgi:hypothetical protein
MILLRPDCLVFKTADGQNVPATAQEVTVELMGEQGSWLDPEIVQNAAAAVLHYFKEEKKQSTVSVAEFSEALERVLRGLGFDVKSAGAPATPKPEPEATPTETAPRRIVETPERSEPVANWFSSPACGMNFAAAWKIHRNSSTSPACATA